MGLNVTREMVKRTAGLAGSERDAQIDQLLADLMPVIEASLDTCAWAPEAMPHVVRGATELAAGELLALMLREPGAVEARAAAGLRVGGAGSGAIDVSDPFGLITRGQRRLRPYLRPCLPAVAPASPDDASIWGDPGELERR